MVEAIHVPDAPAMPVDAGMVELAAGTEAKHAMSKSTWRASGHMRRDPARREGITPVVRSHVAGKPGAQAEARQGGRAVVTIAPSHEATRRDGPERQVRGGKGEAPLAVLDMAHIVSADFFDPPYV